MIQITAIATALIIGIATNAILTAVENSRLGKESEATEAEATEEESSKDVTEE